MIKKILLVFTAIIIFSPVVSFGTVYYVSSSQGNDTNPGTSPSLPWKTLAKLDSLILSPGDSINLKRGDIFHGQITVNGDGTKSNPIKISSYGDGNLPLISAFERCDSDTESFSVPGRDLDFESDTGKWESIADGTSLIGIVNDPYLAQHGTKSLSISKGSGSAYVQNNIGYVLQPSQTYRVSFYVKSADSHTAVVKMQLRFTINGIVYYFIGSNETDFTNVPSFIDHADNQYFNGQTTDWKKCVWSFRTPANIPQDYNTKLILHCLSGNALIDNISVAPQWEIEHKDDNKVIYKLSLFEKVRVVVADGELIPRIDWQGNPTETLISDNSFTYSTDSHYLYLRSDKVNPVNRIINVGKRNNGILIEGKHYINIENIATEGANGDKDVTAAGIRISSNASNITIDNCLAQYCAIAGVLISASHDVVLMNTKVSNNVMDGVSVSIENVNGTDIGCDNITISHVVSHHNGNKQTGGDRGGISVGTIGPTGASHNNIKIEYCYSYNNGGPTQAGSHCDYGIHFWNTSNALVRYCYITENMTGGIKFEQNCTDAVACYNVIAANGLSSTYSFSLSGIFIGPGSNGSKIYNNVIINNKFNKNGANAGISFGPHAWNASNISITNNIICNNSGLAELYTPDNHVLSNSTILANAWFRDTGDLAIWGGRVVSINAIDTEACVAKPLFKTLQDGFPFFLKSESPCAGKGINSGGEEDFWKELVNTSVILPPTNLRVITD